MLVPKQKLSAEQRKLLKLYSALDENDRLSLLAFAEFLLQRAGSSSSPAEAEAGIPLEPKSIPRPEQETVVGAIKRLSASYYMLDKSDLLNETSSLMAGHIMQGRSAETVIEELEALFKRYHQAFVEEHRSK